MTQTQTQTQMKRSMMSQFRKEMNKAGVPESKAENILARIKNGNGGALKSFPRDIMKLAASKITRPRQGVHIRWLGGKKFRVISEDGHRALREAARKNKPWEHATRKKIGEAPAVSTQAASQANSKKKKAGKVKKKRKYTTSPAVLASIEKARKVKAEKKKKS